jgi:hypothetical protein
VRPERDSGLAGPETGLIRGPFEKKTSGIVLIATKILSKAARNFEKI